ncbi:hypothetical protein ACDW82_03215 [Alcaligenes faecalis]|uniref:hypothetical protein n=1 Tax=Alcaligenes TaxID=507 RepID=UPI0035574BC9
MDLPSTVGVGLDVSVHQGGAFPASQDLFEVMAMQVRDRHLSSVGQVGQVVAQYLDGYLERTRLASSRVNDVVGHQAATRFDSPPAAVPGQESDQRVMTALDALNRMFDYSIETQVVVRSATQVSGAVNTLMRGQ